MATLKPDTRLSCLRSCLEILASGQTIQHDADHGDVNPGFIGTGNTLIAFAEAA